MGKSYKKHPVIKDNKRTAKLLKREANKKVRRYKHGIADGKSYRKIYNPWDIHDVVFYTTFEDVQRYLGFTQSLVREGYFSEDVLNLKYFKDLEENNSYSTWRKTYLGK